MFDYENVSRREKVDGKWLRFWKEEFLYKTEEEIIVNLEVLSKGLSYEKKW